MLLHIVTTTPKLKSILIVPKKREYNLELILNTFSARSRYILMKTIIKIESIYFAVSGLYKVTIKRLRFQKENSMFSRSYTFVI